MSIFDAAAGVIQSLDNIARALLSQTVSLSSNPSKFSAYASASTNIAAAFAPTKILFATKEYDTGTNFSSSTFTAPFSGFYQFSAAYRTGSGVTGEFYTIYLYKNGVAFKTGNSEISQGANFMNLFISPPPFFLAAGDTIEVYGAQNSAAVKPTAALSTETYFGGYLVTKA